MGNLSGKVVAITGAGGVICGAIARDVALRGAKVAVLDLSYENAKKVADEIADSGGVALPYSANVLDEEALESAYTAICEDLGSPDILINGAGGNSPRATCDVEYAGCGGDFFSLDSQGVRQVMELNFMGTLLPTKVFARRMAGRNGANVLNISSMNAFRPLTKIPAYSAGKAAVSNFTMWLAVHLAKVGVRVNAIAPGFFLTSQNRALLYGNDGEPTQRTAKILASTPMGRLGEVNELLGAVRLLIDSEEASFITGVVLPIDGGFASYSGV